MFQKIRQLFSTTETEAKSERKIYAQEMPVAGPNTLNRPDSQRNRLEEPWDSDELYSLIPQPELERKLYPERRMVQSYDPHSVDYQKKRLEDRTRLFAEIARKHS